MSTLLPQRTRVSIAGEPPIRLSRFLDDNADGFDDAERDLILAELASRGVTLVGGGAAPLIEIRVIFAARSPRPKGRILAERVVCEPIQDNRPRGSSQSHKPWLCRDCGRRFAEQSKGRDHWRTVHWPASPHFRRTTP